MLCGNAERAGRPLRQDPLRRPSPSAERALLPTSCRKDDDCALVPAALLISPNIRRLAAQRTAAHPTRAFGSQQRDAQRRAETRRRRRRANERHAVGCCGRVGRPCSLESPKLLANAPRTHNHETRSCGEVQWRFFALTLLIGDDAVPSALILILGCTTLWQVRRASGGLAPLGCAARVTWQ
jgi:hypothetical protein